MTKEIDCEKQLQEMKGQIDDLTNKWKRALADYQNLERRTIERQKEIAQYSGERIIAELLTVLDILKEVEKHVKDQGLTLAIKTFIDTLKKEGVEKIEVQEKKFDPVSMECIEVVEGKNDEVVEELREGYALNGKIIRVARVKVGREQAKKEKLSN